MTRPPAVDIAAAVSRRIVAGEIAPYDGALQIWRCLAEDNQRGLEELRAFVGLASEWQDHPDQRDALEADIRDEAARLLERPAGQE